MALGVSSASNSTGMSGLHPLVAGSSWVTGVGLLIQRGPDRPFDLQQDRGALLPKAMRFPQFFSGADVCCAVAAREEVRRT